MIGIWYPLTITTFAVITMIYLYVAKRRLEKTLKDDRKVGKELDE
jgi:membrane protein implicated in regulation of membrane protease activity